MTLTKFGKILQNMKLIRRLSGSEAFEKFNPPFVDRDILK